MKPSFLLALAVLSPFATPTYARPARRADSLLNWVRRGQSKQFYGVYMLGKKVGWMSIGTALAKYNAQTVARQSTEGSLKLRAGGQSVGMQFADETIFSLQGLGPVLSASQRMTQDGKVTLYSLSRDANGRGYHLKTTSAGRTSAKSTLAPRETLSQSRDLENWLRVQTKSGATFTQLSTSLDGADLNSKVLLQYLGRKTIAWGGVPLTVYRVRMNYQGAGFEADVKADGTPLTGRMSSLFEMRAEEEKTAKRAGEAVDMMAASSVPVDTHLIDARLYQSLTLEATGAGDFVLPQSKRQRLIRVGANWQLQMRADAPGNLVEKLSSTQRAKYLEATPEMTVNDAEVRRLAKSIIGKEKAPIAQATLLRAWVFRSLRKSMSSNATTALEVLSTKAGDCTEHSLLFVTLARAAGLPAREVSGLAYLDALHPLFGWHAWGEIYDGTQWVSVDPTWNETWVDASHITFARGSDDLSWTNVLGRLKLKILDAKRAG
jgi:hypothetical protein